MSTRLTAIMKGGNVIVPTPKPPGQAPAIAKVLDPGEVAAEATLKLFHGGSQGTIFGPRDCGTRTPLERCIPRERTWSSNRSRSIPHSPMNTSLWPTESYQLQRRLFRTHYQLHENGISWSDGEDFMTVKMSSKYDEFHTVEVIDSVGSAVVPLPSMQRWTSPN